MPASFLSLPPDQLALVRLVADEASARGVPAYVVGGFVRDLLLKRPGLDLDVVVEGDAIALARALARKHGGHLTAHKQFGTATWKFDDSTIEYRVSNIASRLSSLDFITARRETYATPAALPDVTPSSLDDDLRRRDFTINTLAIRLDGTHFGQLVDRHHAAADLEHGLLRVLHDGSFLDDPTRMFRAVRYEQRYAFRIEPHTLQLLDAARASVSRLSAERTRHELDVVFDEAKPAAVLARLDQLGLLAAVSPALPWSTRTARRLRAGLRAVPEPGWELPGVPNGVSLRWILGYSLWLLELPLLEIDTLDARLSFPGLTLKTVRAAAALYTDLSALKGAQPSRWVDRLAALPLPAVYTVFLATGEPALENYALSWQHVHPKTNGDTLQALGIPAGPAYKKILHRLRAAWLDGEVASDAQERKLLESLLVT